MFLYVFLYLFSCLAVYVCLCVCLYEFWVLMAESFYTIVIVNFNFLQHY